MKVIPSSSKRLTKLAFSAKKPYPGWTASQFKSLAAFTTASMSKYESRGFALIIGYATSAILTGRERRSSLPWIIATSIPISLKALRILNAISPRLAINTRLNAMIVASHIYSMMKAVETGREMTFFCSD